MFDAFGVGTSNIVKAPSVRRVVIPSFNSSGCLRASIDNLIMKVTVLTSISDRCVFGGISLVLVPDEGHKCFAFDLRIGSNHAD